MRVCVRARALVLCHAVQCLWVGAGQSAVWVISVCARGLAGTGGSWPGPVLVLLTRGTLSLHAVPVSPVLPVHTQGQGAVMPNLSAWPVTLHRDRKLFPPLFGPLWGRKKKRVSALSKGSH